MRCLTRREDLTSFSRMQSTYSTLLYSGNKGKINRLFLDLRIRKTNMVKTKKQLPKLDFSLTFCVYLI